MLGIRQVDLGQYLKAGDPIVPLQALDPIYVNFSVPQQQVAEVRVGREVHVTSRGPTASAVVGRITAVDSVVDPATRNVQVQATLANPRGELRPGMFVETQVVTGEERHGAGAAGLGDQLRALRRLRLRGRRREGTGGEPARPSRSSS